MALLDNGDDPVVHLKWFSAATPIIMLLSMAVAGITWGIKLEGRVDQTNLRIDQVNAESLSARERVRILENEISLGVLPIAAEKLRQQQQQIDELKQEIRNCTPRRNQ